MTARPTAAGSPDQRMQIEEFHYRVPWRVRGARPGHHAGTQVGGGYEFRGYASLLAAPDPRRFDARASMRDPFEQIVMRVYSQRSAIPVFAIADLSASMGFHGRSAKLAVLADFIQSLGYSAYRTGDPFGFVGCDTAVRPEWVQPLSRAKAGGAAIAERLRRYAPTGRDCRGMLALDGLLTRSRALVFLLSDFHFPLKLLGRILSALAHHALVPVVLWDAAEREPRGWGLARLRDPETGGERTLLLRPALRARISAAYAERRQALDRCFAEHGSRALYLAQRFDAAAVTRYFYE